MSPGRIPDSDIATIRERVNIADIVGEYVALKPAGIDSLKGLSPFTDEKTPSFYVRPNHGYFHCFSTGEGGDVFSFLMKIDHIGFVEAVEQVADSIGYRINYEGGGTSVQRDRGTRRRLVEANAAAARFYTEELEKPEAQVARDFLTGRGFDADLARTFGCGYAPAGWDTLTLHLQRLGFTFAELEAAGLSKMGSRGTPIDRFHRRLLWPIRNSANEVIGFGARKLFDDDKLGKYMNTPDTVLYTKSQVLFGIDLAKRPIATGHQAVVVEGYTDVMAMHAAGITTAVAACGTAFGDAHLALLRRLMLDDDYFRGEVIYTFDGDSAGQAAALKVFTGEQQFAGQKFVAVAPEDMDPCDLRLKKGDAALRDLIARRVPMFEFAIRALISQFDLDTAEGRVEALRKTVPVVAGIRDSALRDEYARLLAGWTGWDDVQSVVTRVRQEARKGPRRQASSSRSRVQQQTRGGQRSAQSGIRRNAGVQPQSGVEPALTNRSQVQSRGQPQTQQQARSQTQQQTQPQTHQQTQRGVRPNAQSHAQSHHQEGSRSTPSFEDHGEDFDPPIPDPQESHYRPEEVHFTDGDVGDAARYAEGNADASVDDGHGEGISAMSKPRRDDPVLWPQREALKAAMQYPGMAGTVFDSLRVESFTHPAYRAVRAAMEAVGGCSSGRSGSDWITAILQQVSDPTVRSLITELDMEQLRVDEPDVHRYITGVLARLQEVWVGRQVADLKSRLQRMSPAEDEEYRALFGDLVALEEYRRSLQEQAIGDRIN